MVTCVENLDVFNMFPSIGSAGRRFAFLHRVLRGEFPCFIGSFKALRLPAAHPTALRCLRLVVPRWHSLSSLLDGRVRRRGLELVTRYLRPGISEETTGSPKFLGNLHCPFAHVLADAGRTAHTRPLRCSSATPGPPGTKAPTLGLSTPNSMAFGLAVYASQGGLLRPHARLASGYWSGSTAWAFHPQDSNERFQDCFLTSLSSSPKLCLAQWGRPRQIGDERWLSPPAGAACARPEPLKTPRATLVGCRVWLGAAYSGQANHDDTTDAISGRAQ